MHSYMEARVAFSNRMVPWSGSKLFDTDGNNIFFKFHFYFEKKSAGSRKPAKLPIMRRF